LQYIQEDKVKGGRDKNARGRDRVEGGKDWVEGGREAAFSIVIISWYVLFHPK